MHVVATAGHVDHGKSTLVRALTGMEPDRLEEEHQRGLSIELGYVWTTIEGLGDVAFVDVPGHERFLTTMLAGVGPVPAALLVVAADDPWMPQAAEHLAALDALGVQHGVVAVTRSDLADPGPAIDRARAELAGTTLAGARVVPVSGRTGEGLAVLRKELAAALATLPSPDPQADVRLWVDRRFTVRGAGTVVTGTLPAGTVRPGDVLATPGGAEVRVRGVQSLGRTVEHATGVARVALNVVGDGAAALERGTPLLTPAAWPLTSTVDVAVRGATRLPASPRLHVGAAAVGVHVRPLDAAGALARLTLDRPLPLRIGDRALVRDPGSRAVWSVRVLDPVPPALRRRGAARDRAALLADQPDPTSTGYEVRRRGLVSRRVLRRLGAPVDGPLEGALAVGDVLVAPELASRSTARIADLVAERAAARPLDPAVPLAVLAARLRMPEEVVTALVPATLRIVGGAVTAQPADPALPPAIARAVAAVTEELAGAPFAAPTADRLTALGLDARAVAVADRAGALLRVGPGIVLLPGADAEAARRLAELPQPFTTSEARQALGTTRRVVLPLLDHLDRTGRTLRLPDDRRRLR
ncbi:MAG: selenocysteine-specific translation elongation factor [Marmoricola sp.]